MRYRAAALLIVASIWSGCVTAKRTTTTTPKVISAPAAQSLPLCAGSMTKLAGVTCTLTGGRVVSFPSDVGALVQISATGKGAPSLTASDLGMSYDPNGKNALLFQPATGKSWNVKAGQTVTIIVNYTVQGSSKTGLAQLGGQVTGDGELTIAQNVFSSPPASSVLACKTSTTVIVTCQEYGSVGKYASGNYGVSLVLILNGGKAGSVSERLISQHWDQ